MSVRIKLLFFCFCLNFTLVTGQENRDLSQLSFQSLSDSINKYLVNDIAKAVDASNVYILNAQEECDKTKGWEGLSTLGTTYERHREIKKAENYFEKSLVGIQCNRNDGLVIRNIQYEI